MGRLIDAEKTNENAFEVYTKEYGTILVVGVDAINEQSTAYDKDAVIGELHDYLMSITNPDTKLYREIMAIVRKGGINEKVL